MTIADVANVLNGKLMAGDGASPRAVGAVVANDLMSDVLLFDADDPLLLTSLASDQAIRTAHIVGAMGVVVHNSKPLSETMLKVAEDCRFAPCTHTHEPGCAVKEAVENGEISYDRYSSYLGMLDEEGKYR